MVGKKWRMKQCASGAVFAKQGDGLGGVEVLVDKGENLLSMSLAGEYVDAHPDAATWRALAAAFIEQAEWLEAKGDG